MSNGFALMTALALAGCAESHTAAPIIRPSETLPVPTGSDRAEPLLAAAPHLRLAGQWEVRNVGDHRFAAKTGFVNFQSEDFFSHEAGCGGGHPAFFAATRDGALRIWRKEAVVIGKCSTPDSPKLERLLAGFLDAASGWAMPAADTLVLTATDGREALLVRPVGPVPALEGNWRVVSIDGRAWSGPKPAVITITYNWFGASAGCNGGGTGWSTPGTGRITLGSFVATQMGCETALMRAEGELFGAVSEVSAYRLEADGSLILEGPQRIVLRPSG